jgi:ankyrin repeat protein
MWDIYANTICTQALGDRSAENRSTRSPLQLASEIGSLEIVQYLLGHGADVNAPPAQYAGATALQAAARGGYVSIANTLLNHGTDVNAAAAKFNGRTALEGAAEHGRIDMLQLLVDAGADIDRRADSQYTRAVEYAAKNRNNAAKKLLTNYLQGTVHNGTQFFMPTA